MPRQRIEGLGTIGLNTDVQPYALPPAAWTQMSNCQTEDGKLRSIIGEQKLFDLAIKPLYHFPFVDPKGDQLFIVSDGLRVHMYELDGDMVDISPSATEDWSGGVVNFTSLNGVLVVNSVSDGPFYWPGGTDRLAALPGWDPSWRCKMMVAYRYYLVALNMVEGLNEYIHKVRWSNSAAEGDLPTLWIAALDNDAGADLIGEMPGPIVGGALVRDSLYIVKEDSVYSMDWIGGEYVMQLARLNGSGMGTRLQRGFSEMLGGLVMFSTSDVLLFDGNRVISLADGVIRRFITTGLDADLWDMSQVFVHRPSSRLFIGGVRPGTRQLTAAIVYSWEEKTWTTRQLNYSYGFDNAYISLATTVPSWDELDGAPQPGAAPGWQIGVPWDQQISATWDKGVYHPSDPDVVIYEGNDADTAWWVSVVAITSTNSDGSPKTCAAERVGIPIEGADGVAMVTRLWPEVSGTIPIKVSVGAQMSANGPVRWDGPYVVTPGVTDSIAPRVSGRYIAFRVESFDVGDWELGAFTFNWERAGDR
jgi:hypothetical protein